MLMLKIRWSEWRLAWDRWPLRWQLRNLFIWLRVKYFPLRTRLWPELPALNEAQKLRLNAYCQLRGPLPLPQNSTTAREISLKKNSHYVGDLLRCLSPRFLNQAFVKEFGDVNWIPDVPTLLKSRPIEGDNRNAVLLPLDVRRHMCFPHDPLAFENKRSAMVWRGAGYQPHRQMFLQLTAGLSCCDAGDPGLPTDHAHYRPWLSIHQQLRFKYIISVEGNDVATNLKWIMHSNSLCVMAKPKFETWFLESQLMPGVHYAEVKPDYSDLQQVFDYYESHADEAKQIIRQAQAYTRQFLDAASERLLTQHVCQSYFDAVSPFAKP